MAPLPPLGAGTGGPPARSSLMSPQEEAARQAEKEANRRVAQAEKLVEDTRIEAESRVEGVRDQYERREISESDRHLERMEKERMKAYEDLRDLQRAQAAELNRVRREGERDLQQLQNYYRDTLNSTEHRGSENLQNLAHQQARALEFETRARQDEVQNATEAYKRQNEEIRAGHEAKITELNEQTRAEYERMRGHSLQSTEEAEASFTRKFDEKTAAQREALAALDTRASKAVREVRRDYAHKLAAYASRQEDPFYKLMELDVAVQDLSDEYRLTARIPEHEQQHVSVSVRGNQIVLSGYRRNEEKIELEPGRTQGTSSFQSYLETFPIEWPVDAKRMSREFEGDELVVRIPKKMNDHSYQSEKLAARKPARSRLERPKFPDNLPLAEAERKRGNSDEPNVTPPPSKRGARGSGTLT